MIVRRFCLHLSAGRVFFVLEIEFKSGKRKEEVLAHRQMLEKPRSQNVRGNFGEDPSLLVVPPLSVGLIFLAGARGGHGPIQTIACTDTSEGTVRFIFF